MADTDYYVYMNGCRCEMLFNFAQATDDWLLDPGKYLSQGLGNALSELRLESGVSEKIRSGSWKFFDQNLSVTYRATDGIYVYVAETDPSVVHSMITPDGDYDSDHVFKRLIDDAIANTKVYSIEKTLTETEYRETCRDQVLNLASSFGLEDLTADIRSTDFRYEPIFLEDKDKWVRTDSLTLWCEANVRAGFETVATIPVVITSSGISKNTRTWTKPVVDIFLNQTAFKGGFPLTQSNYPDAFKAVTSAVKQGLETQKAFLLEDFKSRRAGFLQFFPDETTLPKPEYEYEFVDAQGIRHNQALACVPCENQAQIAQWLKCVALTRLPSFEDYEEAKASRLNPSKNHAVDELFEKSIGTVAVTDGKTVYCAKIRAVAGYDDVHARNASNLWLKDREQYEVVNSRKCTSKVSQTKSHSTARSR